MCFDVCASNKRWPQKQATCDRFWNKRHLRGRTCRFQVFCASRIMRKKTCYQRWLWDHCAVSLETQDVGAENLCRVLSRRSISTLGAFAGCAASRLESPRDPASSVQTAGPRPPPLLHRDAGWPSDAFARKATPRLPVACLAPHVRCLVASHPSPSFLRASAAHMLVFSGWHCTPGLVSRHVNCLLVAQRIKFYRLHGTRRPSCENKKSAPKP